MKAIYIYNPHDSNEVILLDRARTELGTYIQDIQAVDFQAVRDTFQIAQTPALILIREDLQGANLLDDVNGQLRVTAELWRAIQDEELVIHQTETHRIDNIINSEVKVKLEENSALVDEQVGALLADDTQTPDQIDAIISVMEILAAL